MKEQNHWNSLVSHLHSCSYLITQMDKPVFRNKYTIHTITCIKVILRGQRTKLVVILLSMTLLYQTAHIQKYYISIRSEGHKCGTANENILHLFHYKLPIKNWTKKNINMRINLFWVSFALMKASLKLHELNHILQHDLRWSRRASQASIEDQSHLLFITHNNITLNYMFFFLQKS